MRKLLLLGSMLGLVAMVLPASAMGTGIITEDGKQLSNATIVFEGHFTIETLGSGLTCKNVALSIIVNGTTVTAHDFKVTNPTTECTFLGALYKECAFETHPVADHVDLMKLTVTKGATEHTVDVTAPKDNETHPTLTYELKTRAGSINPCNVTTNDLTIVSETGVNLQLFFETTGGFISSLRLAGQVRLDRGTPAQGTATPVTNVALAAHGTLNLVNPAGTKMTVS